MIQRKADNQTLYRILPDGTEESYSPIDGDKFFMLDEILDKQLAAAQVNKFAQDDYLQKLKNAQIGLDAGKSYVIPAVPKYQGVTDFGVPFDAPFNPPLPLIIYPKITPGSISAIPVDSSQPMVDNTVLLAWLKRIFAALPQPK